MLDLNIILKLDTFFVAKMCSFWYRATGIIWKSNLERTTKGGSKDRDFKAANEFCEENVPGSQFVAFKIILTITSAKASMHKFWQNRVKQHVQ